MPINEDFRKFRKLWLSRSTPSILTTNLSSPKRSLSNFMFKKIPRRTSEEEGKLSTRRPLRRDRLGQICGWTWPRGGHEPIHDGGLAEIAGSQTNGSGFRTDRVAWSGEDLRVETLKPGGLVWSTRVWRNIELAERWSFGWETCGSSMIKLKYYSMTHDFC